MESSITTPGSLPPLPDPLPNLPLEIQFRRLLQACQAQVQAQGLHAAGPGTGGQAASEQQPWDLQAAKLKHYIESLQEQLDELERSHAIELGFKALSAYRQHVAALVAKAPKVVLPAFCQRPKPKAPPPLVPPPVQPSTSQPPGPPTTFGHSNGKGSATDASGPGFSGVISDAAKKKLEHQAQLHESLTDRLGELVGAVKENALGAQAKVEHRGKLVDTADTTLEQNLDKAKTVVAKTKEQYKRGGSNCCLTLGILLLVALLFTGMLVYIKFTHLIGYRALLPKVAKTYRGSQIIEEL